MTVAVGNLRTLILNADMQPLSWAPLSVCNWQDAFVAVHQERVIQVKTYEDVEVHSATQSFEVRPLSPSNAIASARRSPLPGTTCSCGMSFAASTAANGSPPKS